jgi:glycosyltransferase involved in cell wall biosynthesis
MWTKNGARTLPQVLSRINEVVPKGYVNRKFIVDDSSVDDTRLIAKRLGWEVFANEGSGIGDGANTALKHVQSEFFCSFEQDVVLTKDWWSRTFAALSDSRVAVAQGIRFTSDKIVAALEELQNRRWISQSLDNNILRTKTVLELGGFPNDCPVCVDANLRQKVVASGYSWVICDGVVSSHLRSDFLDYLRGQKKWWTVCSHKGEGCSRVGLAGAFLRFLFSPFRGLQIAVKKRMWNLFFAYPLLRGVTLYYAVRYAP